MQMFELTNRDCRYNDEDEYNFKPENMKYIKTIFESKDELYEFLQNVTIKDEPPIDVWMRDNIVVGQGSVRLTILFNKYQIREACSL